MKIGATIVYKGNKLRINWKIGAMMRRMNNGAY
jgi:hypothetical protein